MEIGKIVLDSSTNI